MRIVVLGANGRTGDLSVRRALEAGHAATAVVRDDAKRPSFTHERLRVAVGDPCDPAFLKDVFRDADAVISTLGGRRPTRRSASVLPRSARAIAEAASQVGPRRVVVVSTALLFPPRGVLDRLLLWAARPVAEGAARMEEALSSASLDVTFARCGFLTDRTALAWRAVPGDRPDRGASMSRAALAGFLVDAASGRFAGSGVQGVADARAGASASVSA